MICDHPHNQPFHWFANKSMASRPKKKLLEAGFFPTTVQPIGSWGASPACIW